MLLKLRRGGGAGSRGPETIAKIGVTILEDPDQIRYIKEVEPGSGGRRP